MLTLQLANFLSAFDLLVTQEWPKVFAVSVVLACSSRHGEFLSYLKTEHPIKADFKITHIPNCRLKKKKRSKKEKLKQCAQPSSWNAWCINDVTQP